MQNTVVQELIEIISKVDNNLFSKDTIILALSNYLKVERMQITEAYDNGYADGYDHYENVDYYEETFN